MRVVASGAFLVFAGMLLSSLSWAQESASPIDEVYARIRRLAQESSLDLQIARANAKRTVAAKYTSITRILPHLDLQLSQSRTADFSILQSGALGAQSAFFRPEPQNLARWNLALSLPVYDRSAWLGIEQNSIEARLYGMQLHTKESELDWHLRSFLSQYLIDSYKSATLMDSLRSAETNLREAKVRFELGSRTRIDVLRAKANVASLESKRLSYEQSRATSLHRFLQETGLDTRGIASSGLQGILSGEKSLAAAIDRFSSVEEILPLVEPYMVEATPGEESAPSALEARIAQASPVQANDRVQEELAISRARTALSQEWPNLRIQGNLTKQGPGWKEAFSPGDQSYSIGLVLNVPIFSGGSLFSTSIESSSAQEAARAQAHRDAIQLRNDLEIQAMRIHALRKLIESLKLTLDQNEEVRELSFRSYQLGKATMVELLDSQNALIESKIGLAQSKVDLAVLTRQFAWNLGVILP